MIVAFSGKPEKAKFFFTITWDCAVQVLYLDTGQTAQTVFLFVHLIRVVLDQS